MNFLKEAIIESKKAELMNEIPIGSVLVHNGVIVARAHNTKETDSDPTQHAEIKIIQNYCRKIKSWRLNEYELYSTLEPCLMCAGAILHARISKVIYCCKNSKYSTEEIVKTLRENNSINHTISWEYHNEPLFKEILKEFFKKRRMDNLI